MIESGIRRSSDLTPEEFVERLAGNGLALCIGPFVARVRASVSSLCKPLHSLYGDYPLVADDSVFSFHVDLREVRRRAFRFRKYVRFSVDGRRPHEDMPVEQALPVLEWGINLVIALRSHCFMMLHAATLARGNHALVLPAAPGSGKTTLCAGLVHRGWRLLSDEFGLVRPGSRTMLPVPRPMAIKNESIKVLQEFEPEAWIGPATAGTRKGTVAHVRPPAESIHQQDVVAEPRWIVFPQWRKGARLVLEPLRKADAFMLLATNAFNYELLGEAAFTTTQSIIDRADCYRLEYSDLGEAVASIDELTELAVDA